MPKESENILDKVHKIEKDIHFYKTELLLERPAEYVKAVHLLLSRAEEKRRQLVIKAHQLERQELEQAKKQDKSKK